MQPFTTLFKNKQPINNIRYISSDVGANIIFIPASPQNGYINVEDPIMDFMKTQLIGRFEQITVPPIINNFMGRRLSSQKHYLKIKKALPNIRMNRQVSKQKTQGKINLFDLSGIIEPILALSKTRSKKLTFEYFMKMIDSITMDYKDRKTVLVIYSNKEEVDSDVLNLFDYIAKIQSNRLDTKLGGIIFQYGNKNFPLAIENPDDKTKSKFKLKFLKNMVNASLGVFTDEIEESDDRVQMRDRVIQLSYSTNKDDIQELKDIVDTSGIKGDFEKKLTDIVEYKPTIDEAVEVKDTDKKAKDDEETKVEKIDLESLVNSVQDKLTELNKKYNGNKEVHLLTENVWDNAEIVGMNSFAGFDKQRVELSENLDRNIDDLLSSLTDDKEAGISIMKVTNKVIDNDNNRFKEYSVKIKHKFKDGLKSFDKPYIVKFKVPIASEGKYIKLNSNNYIMINQLFLKPIQKIEPQKVRLLTHYSTSTIELKSGMINKNQDFKQHQSKLFSDLIHEGHSVNVSKVDDDKINSVIDTYGLNIKDFSSLKKVEINIK